MSFGKKTTSLVLLSLPYLVNLSAVCNGVWNGTSGGDWSTSGNWSGCVPGSTAGDTATFPASSSSQTVLVDGAETITSLSFSSPQGSYTVEPSSGGTLAISGNPNTISVSQGQHTITSLGIIDFLTFSTTPLNINITDPAAILTLSTTPSSFPATDPSSIAVTGPGTLLIQDGGVSIDGSSTGVLSITNGVVQIVNTAGSTFPRTGLTSSQGPVNITNSQVSVSNFSNLAPNVLARLTGNGFNIQNSTITGFNSGGGLGIGVNISPFSGSFSANQTVINFTNTGDLAPPRAGSSFGVEMFVEGDFTMTGGSFTLNNSGSLVGGFGFGFVNGVFINVAGDMTLNGVDVSLFNSGSWANFDGGSTINAANLIINEGSSLTLNNTGPVDQGGTGSTVGNSGFTGNMIVNGGNVSLLNSGQATNGALGSSLFWTNVIVNAGQVSLSNTGQVDSTSFGSAIVAQNEITVNGGIIINDATVVATTVSIMPQGSYAGVGLTENYDFNAFFPFPTPTQVTNAGTVIPGDPGPGGLPGTMNIFGSYTQTPSGTLVINLQNPSSFSLLSIIGPASLTGTLEVAQSPNSNINAGDTFIILTASDGVSGTFDQLLNFNIPALTPQARYFPNAVQIFFTPITEKYVNLTRPLLSSINETYQRLEREMGRVRSHFTKPAKQNNKTPKQKQISSSDEVSTQLVAYTELAANNVTKEKSQRLTESLGEERPWNLYMGPKGQVGNVISKEDAQGYSHWSAGGFVGFDYAFSEVGIGLLTEYERMDAHVGKDWGKFTIDHLHADAYATYAPSQLPEIAINGILGGGYDWYSIHREVHTGTPTTEKGSPRGAELDSLLGIEYTFRDSVFTAMPKSLEIIPLASVEYMYIHIADYKEKGSKLNALKVERQNVKSLRSTLGFRVNYTWKTQNVEISPEANFGWQREFLDKERSVDFTPISFTEFPFAVELAKSGRNIALAGLDLLITMYQRHGLEAGYDFEYNSQYHTHFAYLSYNVRF